MEKEFKNKKIEAKRELSQEEKETLASFKTILQPWPWGNQKDKIDLLLVWRGLKSATQINLDPKISDTDLKKMEEVIKNAGLFFKDSGITQDPQKYGSHVGRVCYVANNQEDLDLISGAKKLSTLKADSEMGRMSGFPKSAIENFIQFNKNNDNNDANSQKNFYLTDEEREINIPKKLNKIASFKLSRKNWKEELETARRWAKEIKFIAPELYENLY